MDVYPSLMAADQLRLGYTIDTLAPFCTGFHLDVMDNHFVPNLALGRDACNHIAAATTKRLWVHLMIENPVPFLKQLTLPPRTIVSVHAEVCSPTDSVWQVMAEQQLHPSIAINPDTAIERILPYVSKGIDRVLMMGVHPGYSGQTFIQGTFKRITTLQKTLLQEKLDCTIQLDGGVNKEIFLAAQEHGIEEIVLGSALFSQPDLVTTLKEYSKF